MLKFISEGHFSKIWYNINSTNGSDHEIDFKFLRVFDNTQAAGLTITTNDIVGKLRLRKAGEYVVKSISHINGAKEENSEIEYNIQGTQAEKNFESDMVIHNHAVNFELASGDWSNLLIYRLSPDSRAVHTGATVNHLVEYVKVSDYCQLNTDATTAYIGDTTYDDTPLSSAIKDEQTYIAWVNNKTALASQGYVVSKAAVETYGNANQAVLECSIKSELALPRHIGDNYSFDLTTLFPAGYTPVLPYSEPADYTDGNCQLIETEFDPIKGISKIKLFVRSD